MNLGTFDVFREARKERASGANLDINQQKSHRFKSE